MTMESAGNLPTLSSMLGLGGPFRKGMVFLINFAWASRIRLPILIIVGFMIFDVRMQLEINVDVDLRQVPHIDTDSEGDDSSEGSYSESEEENEAAAPAPAVETL